LKNSRVQRREPASGAFSKSLAVRRLGGGGAANVGGLCRHWHALRSPPSEPSKVLRGHGEHALVLGAARATQPQARKSQYAFERGEQHLDLLPSPTGRFICRRLNERPRKVAGIFIQIAQNLPRHGIRAAPIVPRDPIAR